MTTTPAADIDRALWALQGYDTTALGTTGADGPHVAGVYYAPERHGEGLRLLLSVLDHSRKLQHLEADPRVAFMCSPGAPSRWIQGSGRAEVVRDQARFDELFARLVAHAPGARDFVERLPVVPVIITVGPLKVVDPAGAPPLSLELAGA